MFKGSKWEHHYEDTQKQYRKIMELISKRTKQSKASSSYSNLTDQISYGLYEFKGNIDSLSENITPDITRGERQRRETLIEELRSKEKNLKQLFEQTSLISTKQQDEERQRNLLFFEGGGIADLGQADDWVSIPCNTGGRQAAGAASASLHHEDVTKTRENILAEQDRGLDSLYNIIVRQKNIAQNIESEVDTQNDVLNDIETGLERTNQHLLDTTRTVQRVHQRDKGVCSYWIVICILTIVIIIITAIPRS